MAGHDSERVVACLFRSEIEEMIMSKNLGLCSAIGFVGVGFCAGSVVLDVLIGDSSAAALWAIATALFAVAIKTGEKA